MQEDFHKGPPLVLWALWSAGINQIRQVFHILKHNYPLSPPIIFRQASSAEDRIVPLVHTYTNGLTSYTFYATGEKRSITSLSRQN